MKDVNEECSKWKYKIYKHTINQKSYVGYSVNVKGRLRSHMSSKGPFGVAIRKSGFENVKTEVLMYSNNLKLIKQLEIAFISFYDVVKNGYNLSPGASGPGEDGKKRISEARRGTCPMVDSNGISVGTHSTSHPKYINKKWVHHSKGWVSMLNTITNEIERIKTAEIMYYHTFVKSNKNENNPTALKISKEEILKYSVDAVLKYGRNIKTENIKKLVKQLYGVVIPSSGFGYRGTSKEFRDLLNQKTNLKYNRYYLTKEQQKMKRIRTMITKDEQELIDTINDFKHKMNTTEFEIDKEWYQDKIDELEDLLEILKENKGTL